MDLLDEIPSKCASVMLYKLSLSKKQKRCNICIQNGILNLSNLEILLLVTTVMLILTG